MDFSLSEEQAATQKLFREFAEAEIRPAASGLDREPRFPAELFRKAGELGFFGMRYDPPSGSGADLCAYLLAVEELARGSLAVAAACTMQSLMGTFFLHRFATGDVRERILAPALAGELVGTICMTEPDAGSDLFSMRTAAVECGGRWRISGRKTWITSAPAADLFTVFARTGDEELSIFLVERGAEGLEVGRAIEKMGVRASVTSEVSFEDAPATCMLGERGGGMDGLKEILVDIRLMTAALALGVARAAYEDSLAYSTERVQFGRPICKFQAVAAHLAEMRTCLAAAHSLTHWAAWRAESGAGGADEAAMAKLFASESALDVCDRAARVMASYGYASEYPIERYLRDVRFTLIGGGTSEILRGHIARGATR
ncbi:MAG TPA: acyl-CoA dehydrogenase family protein [Planctomycetota bacterium]|nr:acyl-CoA dehydrogenase family protein [Planctomycetota bacterium]